MGLPIDKYWPIILLFSLWWCHVIYPISVSDRFACTNFLISCIKYCFAISCTLMLGLQLQALFMRKFSAKGYENRVEANGPSMHKILWHLVTFIMSSSEFHNTGFWDNIYCKLSVLWCNWLVNTLRYLCMHNVACFYWDNEVKSRVSLIEISDWLGVVYC